jgi:putative effector of murein hydrolase
MALYIRNLVLFKLGWVACVMLAAAGQPLMATLVVAAVVAAHLATVPVKSKESMLLVSAALIGMTWESLLVKFGIVSYSGYPDAAAFAPYWIVAMWVLFATTINQGLRWIKRSWIVASAAGLIGGPLAFFSGAQLGAVEFSNTALALATIGVGWAVLLPILALVADTIIDSAWLEPRDGLPTEAKPAGAVSAMRADPVLVPVRAEEVRYGN